MIVATMMLALLITTWITNKRNSAVPTDEMLDFGQSGSLLVILCLASSIVLQIFQSKVRFLDENRYIVAAALLLVYSGILTVANISRERKIQQKHDQILKIYQALADIFGNIQPQDVNFAELPFKMEEDKKTGSVSKITIDTTKQGLKINDNSIIYAQYSLNKYFPELQWTSNHDAPNRQLIYQGLPKPPKIAKYPGSDYRPSGWIPLGLAGGNAEICWNIADQKDPGMSSYINEDGVQATTLKLPSAPQCMCLGSTGGGKAIWVGQSIDVKRL